MTVWFTSDLHFGHRLVAKHRGFEDDTEAHDQAIMENWAKVVRPDHHVWILGDLSVGHPEHPLRRIKELPGHKHLIAGNHDACHPMHRESFKQQRHYFPIFDSVQAFARRRINGEQVLLSHFPYARDRGEARYTQYRLRNEGLWLLHGHTHGTERVTAATSEDYPHSVESREIHVGLDAWDLKPVSINTIADLMKQEGSG